MAVINQTVVPTERLTWEGRDKLFVAEASDLPDFTQVYDDACDVGFTLRSHRTGHLITVVIDHEERDREGEILFWDLKPVKHSERDLFTVRVFND